MTVRFVFDDVDVDIETLTVLEAEAVDAMVNEGKPPSERVSWAIVRPALNPTVARATARACFAHAGKGNAQELADAMTAKQANDAFVEVDDDLPKEPEPASAPSS